MRWFVVASVAVWSASALAADVSDGGVIPLPPVVVPLGAADVPNASSPTQRDPSATTTVIETKSRVAEAKDAAELIAASPGAVLQDQGGAGQRKTLSAPLWRLRRESRFIYQADRDVYVWGDARHVVWGATWRMLDQLVAHVTAIGR